MDFENSHVRNIANTQICEFAPENRDLNQKIKTKKGLSF